MSEEWGYHRHYEEWEGAEKAKGKRKRREAERERMMEPERRKLRFAA